MSGFIIAEIDGSVNANLTDQNGNPFTEANPLPVRSAPPTPPPSTTLVDVAADSTTSSQTGENTDFTIPNGKMLTLQYIYAGAGMDTGVGGGSVAEFYFVSGAVETIIEPLFVNGASYSSPQFKAYGPGDAGGTKKIRMRRKRLSPGSVRIFGRFVGYHT